MLLFTQIAKNEFIYGRSISDLGNQYPDHDLTEWDEVHFLTSPFIFMMWLSVSANSTSHISLAFAAVSHSTFDEKIFKSWTKHSNEFWLNVMQLCHIVEPQFPLILEVDCSQNPMTVILCISIFFTWRNPHLYLSVMVMQKKHLNQCYSPTKLIHDLVRIPSITRELKVRGFHRWVKVAIFVLIR